MKKYTVFCFIFISLFVTLFKESVFADSKIFTLTFSVSDLEFASQNGYDIVSLLDCYFSIEPVGSPQLPVRNVDVLIPREMEIDDTNVLYSTMDDISGSYYLFPVQYQVPITEYPPPFVPPDPDIYNSSIPYREELVKVINQGYYGDYHIVRVLVYPLQYIPVDRQLRLYTSITIAVNYHSAPGTAPVMVQRQSVVNQYILEQEIEQMVVNPEDLSNFYSISLQKQPSSLIPKKLSITSLPSTEGSSVDYLIITSDDLAPAFQDLANWKTQKGIPTVIRTVQWIDANYTGCDVQEKMRKFIEDARTQWGVYWILLGGDTDVVPSRMGFWDDYNNVYGPTDLYYSGCNFGNWNANGNAVFGELGDNVDYSPDVRVGRVPASNITEVQTFVNKILTYEKTPPLTDYVNKVLFIGASLDPSGTDGHGAKDKESIGNNYLIPVGIYPYKLYAPKQGSGWLGDDILTRETAISQINSGYHIINHIDHSGPYSIGTGANSGGGIMVNEDADLLNNGPKYSILWTYGCDPNSFDHDSFSEHFINNHNGGGIAFIGNTRTGYGGQITQDKAFFYTIFKTSSYHLGQAFVSSQQATLSNYHKCNLNLLGDPEMPIWTNTPATLTVTHPASIEVGPTNFTVHTGVAGALVCLQKGNEAYASNLTNSSGDVTFFYTPETEGTINITVTAHNYIPYEGTCTVTQKAKYIYYSSSIIDDDNVGDSNGNGDGKIDAGETIELFVRLRNSGTVTVNDVATSLFTTDANIEILAGSVNFIRIPGGTSKTSEEPFIFRVPGNYVPADKDYIDIPFTIDIQTPPYINGWHDNFILTALSPKPEITGNTVEIIHDNGNQIIDANETVEVSITLTNRGSGSARGVIAEITTIDPDIEGIGDAQVIIGDISSNSFATSGNKFRFTISPSYITGSSLDFSLTITTDYPGQQWTFPFDLTAPTIPTGLVYSPGNTYIDLKWNPVSGAKGYNVYRSTSSAGTFTRINGTLITNYSYYQDTGLSPLTHYYYYITAQDASGNESTPSPILDTKTMLVVPDKQTIFASPVYGDLDGDGDYEIIVASRQGNIYVWNSDGTGFLNTDGLFAFIPNIKYSFEEGILSTPAVGNVSEDTKLEIIVVVNLSECASDIYAYHPDGSFDSC